MKLDISGEVAAMRQMTVAQLRARHLELFGEPSRSRNKPQLIKRIAWRIQSMAEGDISERARRRAAELANDADLRTMAPKSKETADNQFANGEPSPPRKKPRRLPMPGTLLSRMYKGRQVNVKILDQGFEYEGRAYQSLSAVARAITGSHWNGYHFFGLSKNGKAK